MKIKLTLVMLAGLFLAGCGNSHSPVPRNSESVVGNGGSDLVPTFRDYIKDYYARNPGVELTQEFEGEHRSHIQKWLASGHIAIVAVRNLPNGRMETSGIDPHFGQNVIYIDADYWRDNFDSFSLYPDEEGERVWQTLVEHAVKTGVVPRTARRQKKSLHSQGLTPLSLSRPRFGDKLFTPHDLPELLRNAIHLQVLPKVKGSTKLTPADKEALVNFLKSDQFRVRVKTEELSDRFARPVIALLDINSKVCEFDASRWLLYFDEEGYLEERKVPTLFHEVMRQAQALGIISDSDEYFFVSYE